MIAKLTDIEIPVDKIFVEQHFGQFCSTNI